jgi:uncharacterized membrane protein (DUF373 family)
MRPVAVLGKLEDLIYYLIAAVLIIAAACMLAYSAFHFASNITVKTVHDSVLSLLESLLLVMMLVEILHTVTLTISQHVLIADPFLAVGLIAAIRRMLVITVELEQPSATSSSSFHALLSEMGLLGAVILVLTVSIYILRSKRETVPMRSLVGKPQDTGDPEGG